MKRYGAPLVLMTCLALSAVVLVAFRDGNQGNSRVYSVAAIRDQLVARSEIMVGRTLLVRGRLVPCRPSGLVADCTPRTWHPLLLDAEQRDDELPLVWESSSKVVGFLRRFPMVKELLPGAQTLRWGVVTTYRVRIEVLADNLSGAANSYQAVVLDATPDG